MKSFHVFTSPTDGAVTLVSHNNPNFMDYEERLILIKSGSHKECCNFIEQYRDENYIPDELINYLN